MGSSPIARSSFAGARFVWAVVLGLATLFVVGASRSLFTARGWFVSGCEMMMIGALAGAAAYAVGALGAAIIGGVN